jgi:hypothetical protein
MLQCRHKYVTKDSSFYISGKWENESLLLVVTRNYISYAIIVRKYISYSKENKFHDKSQYMRNQQPTSGLYERCHQRISVTL